MAKKMSKGLIALSSAAIVSVYGAGYALTQPAAVSMAAGQTSSTLPAAVAASDGPSTSSINTSSASGSSSIVAPAAPAATATSTSSNASGLKDGTYTGSGMSRHGGVNVKVTVQNGRITAAPITGVTTRYSQSVIAALPAQVVSKQSSQVNLVSGATDSSMAYQQAVAQALNQAGATTPASGTPTTGGSTTAGSTTSGGNVQVTGPNGVIYSNGGTSRQGRGRGYYGG